MSGGGYSPFSDCPRPRSSLGRNHSRSPRNFYGQRRDLTPDCYMSSSDRRADYSLRNGYDDVTTRRDLQLIQVPRTHLIRETWSPPFAGQFASYTSDPDVDWSGDEIEIEDRRYYEGERRREWFEWERREEPHTPRSRIQYVRRSSVERRHPHITGYHGRFVIDGRAGGRQLTGYGYGAGYEEHLRTLGDRDYHRETEFDQRIGLYDEYQRPLSSGRRRRYLR